MKLFDKTRPETTSALPVRVLSAAELDAIAGGLNPQPLPPGRAMDEFNPQPDPPGRA